MIKKIPSSSFHEVEKVEKIKTGKYKIFKYHEEFYQRISLHRLYSDSYKWKLKNNKSEQTIFHAENVWRKIAAASILTWLKKQIPL